MCNTTALGGEQRASVRAEPVAELDERRRDDDEVTRQNRSHPMAKLAGEFLTEKRNEINGQFHSRIAFRGLSSSSLPRWTIDENRCVRKIKNFFPSLRALENARSRRENNDNAITSRDKLHVIMIYLYEQLPRYRLTGLCNERDTWSRLQFVELTYGKYYIIKRPRTHIAIFLQ